MTIHTHLSYLEKNRFVPRQITTSPTSGLGMVVVIPCHNEPDLVGSLQSLADCTQPACEVEVIVVINSGPRHEEEVLSQNLKSLAEASEWKKEKSPEWLTVHLLHFPDLPRKHAGVGLARKIGMDEAADRLLQADCPAGILLCYDADCRCDPNYLETVYQGFNKRPKGQACSIYFEHPTEGPLPDELYQGIVKYELFLRYYIQGLRFAGYPYDFHTIGSSMAVRADAYQQQGGMNRRKAGEDFYFLHKFMPLGNFFEINGTRVIPSPRTSDRVPFGTGKAMGDWMESERREYSSYDFQSFKDLKAFIGMVEGQLYATELDGIPDFFAELPATFQSFLDPGEFGSVVKEAKKHSRNEGSFKGRFYQWFNGLKVLKLVHFARDGFYPNRPIKDVAGELLVELGLEQPQSELEMLQVFRSMDRKH